MASRGEASRTSMSSDPSSSSNAPGPISPTSPPPAAYFFTRRRSRSLPRLDSPSDISNNAAALSTSSLHSPSASSSSMSSSSKRVLSFDDQALASAYSQRPSLMKPPSITKPHPLVSSKGDGQSTRPSPAAALAAFAGGGGGGGAKFSRHPAMLLKAKAKLKGHHGGEGGGASTTSAFLAVGGGGGGGGSLTDRLLQRQRTLANLKGKSTRNLNKLLNADKNSTMYASRRNLFSGVSASPSSSSSLNLASLLASPSSSTSGADESSPIVSVTPALLSPSLFPPRRVGLAIHIAGLGSSLDLDDLSPIEDARHGTNITNDSRQDGDDECGDADGDDGLDAIQLEAKRQRRRLKLQALEAGNDSSDNKNNANNKNAIQLVSSYLYKRSTKFGINSWGKRYFEIARDESAATAIGGPNSSTYQLRYSTNDKTPSHGVIHLGNRFSLSTDESSSASEFTVITPVRHYMFRAETPEVAKQWTAELYKLMELKRTQRASLDCTSNVGGLLGATGGAGTGAGGGVGVHDDDQDIVVGPRYCSKCKADFTFLSIRFLCYDCRYWYCTSKACIAPRLAGDDFPLYCLECYHSRHHRSNDSRRLMMTEAHGQSNVLLNVLGVRGLPTVDGDVVSPYVVITYGDRELRTETRRNTADPDYYQEFCFPLTSPNAKVITLTVYHNDRFGIDDFLGSVTIPLLEMDSNIYYDDVFQLKNMKRHHHHHHHHSSNSSGGKEGSAGGAIAQTAANAAAAAAASALTAADATSAMAALDAAEGAAITEVRQPAVIAIRCVLANGLIEKLNDITTLAEARERALNHKINGGVGGDGSGRGDSITEVEEDRDEEDEEDKEEEEALLLDNATALPESLLILNRAIDLFMSFEVTLLICIAVN
jgi:hypothetical protein